MSQKSFKSSDHRSIRPSPGFSVIIIRWSDMLSDILPWHLHSGHQWINIPFSKYHSKSMIYGVSARQRPMNDVVLFFRTSLRLCSVRLDVVWRGGGGGFSSKLSFSSRVLPVLVRENVHKRSAARAGRSTMGARRVRSCLLSCSFSWTRLVSVSGRARMSLSPEQHSG